MPDLAYDHVIDIPWLAHGYFESLGHEIDQLWHAADRREAEFAGIAQDVIAKRPPERCLTFSEILRAAFLGPMPIQVDLEASFGQPPFTVYFQEDFQIELLFWTEGLPGIHQHSFSGAFHVFLGSSLHTEWTFHEIERPTQRLAFGNLALKKSELLCVGDTRPIVAGSSFIHTTFHLDRPSVSMVVRTNRPFDLPQYVYLYPSIAFASQELVPSIRRRAQLLTMLARAGRYGELLNIILHYIERTDISSAFYCLHESHGLLRDEHDRELVLGAASRRFPKMVEHLRPALKTSARRERIRQLRNTIMNSDLQFFLALLLNVPDRGTIVDMIASRYGSSNVRKRLSGWLVELFRIGVGFEGGLIDPMVAKYVMENPCDQWGGVQACDLPASVEDLQLAAKNLSSHWLWAPLLR